MSNVGEFDPGSDYQIRFFKGFKVLQMNDIIFISASCYEKGVKKDNVFIYNVQNRKIRIADRKDKVIRFLNKDRISITETMKHFKNMLFFKENGLPDPLPFLKGSYNDKRLFRIMLGAKGNHLFRLAVVGKWIREKRFKLIRKLLSEYPRHYKPSIKYFQAEEKRLIEELLLQYGQ